MSSYIDTSFLSAVCEASRLVQVPLSDFILNGGQDFAALSEEDKVAICEAARKGCTQATCGRTDLESVRDAARVLAPHIMILATSLGEYLMGAASGRGWLATSEQMQDAAYAGWAWQCPKHGKDADKAGLCSCGCQI